MVLTPSFEYKVNCTTMAVRLICYMQQKPEWLAFVCNSLRAAFAQSSGISDEVSTRGCSVEEAHHGLGVGGCLFQQVLEGMLYFNLGHLSSPQVTPFLRLQQAWNGQALLLSGRKWISVDATDLFKLQNLVVQLSTELFDFQRSLI